jgi:transcription elongation factor GreB
MSKAFTSESDAGESFIEPPPLPPGVKNYMTAAGVERMKKEVERLNEERAGLKPEDVKDKARTEIIDRRLRFLVSRLESAIAIDPLSQPKEQVLFGATVTIRPQGGDAQTWRIVGLDETDLDRGWISWMSPLATALLSKSIGETVPFQNRKLTVETVTYEP